MGCTFELRFFSYEILIIDSQERRRLKIDMMIAITFLDPVLSNNCFILTYFFKVESTLDKVLFFYEILIRLILIFYTFLY